MGLPKTLKDHRWIYLITGILMCVPFIHAIGIPTKISGYTWALYNYIEELPEGSVVLIVADIEPGGWGELGPQFESVLAHLLSRKLKLVFIAFFPATVSSIERALSDVDTAYGVLEDKAYGEDYVNLGFHAGEESLAAALGDDFQKAIETDVHGTPVSTIALTKNITDHTNFAMVYNVASKGLSLTYTINQWAIRYGMPLAISQQALSYNACVNWYDSGICIGFTAGTRGASEYEFASERIGMGTKFLDSLNMAHIFAIVCIVAGNIVHWWPKLTGGEK